MTQESSSISETLLDRLRVGQEQAWHRLVELFGPLVYYWCHDQLQHADREDVVQEVFKAVAANLHTFQKKRPGAFRGWLRTITSSKICDHFRRSKSRAQAMGGSAYQQALKEMAVHRSDPADSSADGDVQRGLMHRALELIRDEFDDRTWKAFGLTMFDGYSSTEAAATLGMTANAVRKAKARILQRLRKEFGDLL